MILSILNFFEVFFFGCLVDNVELNLRMEELKCYIFGKNKFENIIFNVKVCKM